MGLGNNRDYVTTERRAKKMLDTHTKRMQELMDAGMDREHASKQAFAEVVRKSPSRAGTEARETNER